MLCFFAIITNWSKITITFLILFEHENDEKKNKKSYIFYAVSATGEKNLILCLITNSMCFCHFQESIIIDISYQRLEFFGNKTSDTKFLFLLFVVKQILRFISKSKFSSSN
jgi:hypothetical protein